MRVLAETARSRLTLEPSSSDPRFVRLSVSGAAPILKEDLLNSVTVRHVPSEIRRRKLGYNSQHTIDADAVAQMAITQYVIASRNCQ